MKVFTRLLATSFLLLSAVIFAAPAVSQAALKPVFGRSIVVRPVGGQAYVGRSPATRLRSATLVHSGSIIDVSRNGAMIELITAAPRRGAIYTADLSGGVERITQPRGQGGLTIVSLVGKRAPCGSASAAKYVVRTTRISNPSHHGSHVRAARASSTVGPFRLVGRNESAVNQGAATWHAQDSCTGTMVGDTKGKVTASLKNGAQSSGLSPGETWLSKCATPAQAEAVGLFCVAVLGEGRDGTYTTGLFIKGQLPSYDLCQASPDGASICRTWTLTAPDDDGFREGFITCWVSQPGSYSFTWQIAGDAVQVSLPYTANSAAKSAYPCLALAGTSVFPAGPERLTVPSNVKIVNRYALPTAAWLLSIDVYARPSKANETLLEGVVYGDSAGAPGRLVATGLPKIVKGTGNENEPDLLFFPPPYLPAGNYWFGVLTGAAANVSVTPTAAAAFNRNPFVNGASDPFGPISAAKYQLSLNVSYSLDPVPGAAPPPAPTGG